MHVVEGEGDLAGQQVTQADLTGQRTDHLLRAVFDQFRLCSSSLDRRLSNSRTRCIFPVLSTIKVRNSRKNEKASMEIRQSRVVEGHSGRCTALPSRPVFRSGRPGPWSCLPTPPSGCRGVDDSV